MRRFALAAVFAAALPGTALAQVSEQANRRAYELSIQCFATQAGVISDPRSTPEVVADGRVRSRRAFDAAVRMGRVLGLSGSRIDDDINTRARIYATAYVAHDDQFQRSRAECARLGM